MIQRAGSIVRGASKDRNSPPAQPPMKARTSKRMQTETGESKRAGMAPSLRNAPSQAQIARADNETDTDDWSAVDKQRMAATLRLVAGSRFFIGVGIQRLELPFLPKSVAIVDARENRRHGPQES